jgi:hypothetical protein
VNTSLRLAQRILAVTLMWTLVGCTEKPDESAGEPPLPSSLPSVDVSSMSLPLDRYSLDPEQAKELNYAREVLIVKCLRRFGIDRRVAPRGKSRSESPHERRYGISDEVAARTYGYHPAPAPEDDQPDGGESALTGEERAIAFGSVAVANGEKVPDGGCVAEADKSLLGGKEVPQTDLVETLKASAFARARADSRVTKAYDAWSTCMSGRGFEYSDPWAAVNDPKWQTSDSVSSEEIATATADVGCKRTANLFNVFAAVEAAYQTRDIERHAPALSEYKANVDTRLRNAQAIAAQG